MSRVRKTWRLPGGNRRIIASVSAKWHDLSPSRPSLPESVMAQTVRPVAIVGSNRIPFCRIFTGYADIGNLEMLTAAVTGLVEKYNLKGEILGDVVAGAV